MNEEIFNECEKLSYQIAKVIKGHNLKVVCTSVSVSIMAMADMAENAKRGEGKELLKGFIKILLKKAQEF